MLPSLPPGLPQFTPSQASQLQAANYASTLQLVSSSAVSSIVGGLSNLNIEDPNAYTFTPPPRPSFGTEGKVIKLRANHFQIQIPKGFIFHYTVNIQPDKCPKRINRLVII